MAERIQEALEEYKSKEDDIKRMKAEMGGMGEAIPDEMGLISDNTQVRQSQNLKLWSPHNVFTKDQRVAA